MITNRLFFQDEEIPTDDSYDTFADQEGMLHWAPIKIPDSMSSMKESKSDRTCSLSDCTEADSLLGSNDHKESLSDRLSALFGFEKNPFGSGGGIRNSRAADMRLAMLSNFSTAYNVVSISLTLDIMHNIYHSSPEVKSLCSSALIAGMIAGQIAGGAVGDILGRHLAMAVVMTLQIVGAIATATATNGYISIYTWIAFWRFILGVGCGGVYPLAATITAEANAERNESSKAVALAFSMQGIGYLVAPVLTSLLTTVFPHQHWLCWRLVLGFGAIPGLWLLVLRIQAQVFIKRSRVSDEIHEKMVQATALEVPASMLDSITHENDLLRKLLGTAGCWFLFDVLFYGNVLFSPVVLSAAFGSDETVRKVAIHTSLIAGLAVPGYFVSVIMMGRQSPRFIQAQGFLCMAILYTIIGFKFHELADQKFMLILLYGSTFFFSNYGPNATTYVLPSVTFSRSCRSTLNGICAACGKVGALLGSTFFVTAAARFGNQAVMLSCAVISLIGLVVTLFCVPETPLLDDDNEPDNVRGKVPMKIVHSEPSLLDYYAS